MELLLLSFLTAFAVVLFATPSLIKVAILKRLFDEPREERKLHKRVIPTVGGIIIFAGTFLSFVLWFPSDSLLDLDVSNSNYLKNALALDFTKSALNDFKYILATVLILFFVGAKDDIIGTSPIKRLAAHILVAMMIVLIADIRIKGLHGIFGVDTIPYWSSIFLSMFSIIVIINAFNLIDGVDGLASGIGFIASVVFGISFFLGGDIVMSILAFSLAGALFAFLFFNFSPASIFMGDAGATIIGLMMAVFAIKVVESPKADIGDFWVVITHRPTFVMSALSYPLIDTLRIFVYRTTKGVSPFTADRNHIHHVLLDSGMSHRQTSLILYGATLLIISLSLLLYNLDPTSRFVAVFVSAITIAQVPFFIRKKPNQNLNGNGNGYSKVSEEAKKKLFQEKGF